jgi:hypothetical protein
MGELSVLYKKILAEDLKIKGDFRKRISLYAMVIVVVVIIIVIIRKIKNISVGMWRSYNKICIIYT